MKKFFGMLAGFMMVLMPYIAWAEGAHGYSRGNAFMYFAAIATVLIYGIHDVFRRRSVTLAAAVLIPVTLYLMLPDK
jgi:tryptophan-rich sensory protein